MPNIYKVSIGLQYFEYGIDEHFVPLVRCRLDLWEYLRDYTTLDINALKLHLTNKRLGLSDELITRSICSPDRVVMYENHSRMWVSLEDTSFPAAWFEIESECDALLLKLFV